MIQEVAIEGPTGSDLFALMGRLIPQLQVTLEVNLTGDREAEGWLREINTSSTDAYRLYLRGHEAWLASRWKESIASLEQAVALDSTFAYASVDLAAAYWNSGQDAKMRLMRARLERMRPRLDLRERQLHALFDAAVADNADSLVQMASVMSQRYPENRFYTYLLGAGYFDRGDWARCVATMQPLIAQRYSWSWTYYLSALASEKLGDVAAARRAFEEGA